jgi:amino acid adenylation domain-containing protein
MDELSNRISDLSPARRALLERRLKPGGRSPEIAQTIKPRADRRSAPASFAQQRLWFLQQLDLSDASYNVPRAIHLKGSLDVPALRRTLAEIVQRHEVLRTHFANVDGLLQQIISSDAIPLSVIDLSKHPRAERESKSDQLVAAEATNPFDLEQGPVMRTTLLRLGEQEHIFLLTLHHVVSDAWSAEILFQELGELYEAFSSGRPSPLPPLPIQYADFAEWQREYLQGAVHEEQLAYWKKQLAGINHALALITDHPRPPVQTFRGKYRSLDLPRALSEKLATLSRREGVTTFMTMLAAFDVLLARYTGQEDVVIGTPIVARNREEIERLIGCFVNTLVLRADLSGNPSFSELLRRVREVALEAYAHQELPFEKLVEELEPERSLSHSPLFQVMFAWHHASRVEIRLPGLTLDQMPTETSTSKFDLSLVVSEESGNLSCTGEYNTDLFAGTTIERLLGHYQRILEAVVANPEERISELPLLTRAEREQLVVEWNHTRDEVPTETIDQLFEAQVERTPNVVAVKFGDLQMTYRDLNSEANRLAHHLRRFGIGPETRVAICVEPSLDMIVGLMGILKAGGAYVPLEPEYPSERISFILEDSEARLLLTQQRFTRSLTASNVQTIYLDSDWLEIARENNENPLGGATAENSAHLIYTSGSTGQPKGVLTAHRASVNRLAWMWQKYPFVADEVCCQKTSLTFVDSISEIFGPLLHGVPLVIIPESVVKDPQRFVAALAANKVTRLVLVPSLLRVILEIGEDLAQNLCGLRYCVCSGETLPVNLATILRERIPQTTLINMYGSSEVAADVTCYEVRNTDGLGAIPIGRPIANTEIYILDSSFQPAPVGVPGEIYVGGEGLARGYLNRPDLTAEKFIPHPFSRDRGARLFRTGDIGRYLSDGDVEYRGRRDNQVKLRGFRIELGEIEAVLASHPAVRQTVVIARDDERGDRQLLAYVVPAGEAQATNELRAHLRRKLPNRMIPTAFVSLDALPLTASGKVNRLALPLPGLNQRPAREDFVVPRTPTEEILAGVWADVLDEPNVGVNDDFFALGGHSLLLARIASRIRESFQLELPLRALFEAPTLAALAERIETARRTTPGSEDVPLVSVSRSGALPLSFAQERLWFFDQLEPDSAAYNIPRALRLKGPLDGKALQESLEAIFARHEVLRLVFLSENGKPKLSFAEPGMHEIPVFDLSQLPADEQEEKARELVAEQTQRPFDLTRGPLLRSALVRLGVEDHVLMLTMHHIVSDGWSIGIVLRELASLYNSITTGSDQSLPELQVQYADFAAWQRQYLSVTNLEKQLEFWRAQLEGAPAEMNLPADRPRPAVRSFRGARHSLTISKEVADGLKKLARGERVTLFMILLAAFQLLLSCLTRGDDIVVGSPTAGRNRPETEGLIGNFVNTLVLRKKLAADRDFRETVRRVRETTLAAYSNQDVPFEHLVEELRPQRSLKFNPLFQVWFVLQSAPVEQREWRDLTVRSIDLDSTTTRHDLQLTLWKADNSLAGAFTYSTDLFDPETIDCISEQFESLLAIVIERPEIRLSMLRAKLDDVGRAYRRQRAEKLEDAGREKLKSVKRRAVTMTATQD